MIKSLSRAMTTSSALPLVVFILGGPCSGKGTQSLMVQEHLGFKHLSAGELLREQRKNPKSAHGDLIQSTIVAGKIVPSFITVSLLDRAMGQHQGAYNKFLVDGFPRNMENLQEWNKAMGQRVATPFILFLTCSEATMVSRLQQRSATSGRSDDNIEVMRKRFKTFNEETIKVVDWFRESGRVIEASAENSVDSIFAQISRQMNRRLY